MPAQPALSPGPRRLPGLLAICAALLARPAVAQSLVSPSGGAADFPLADRGRVALVWYDTADAKVVGIAARDFALDVERVAGARPAVVTDRTALSAPAVLVGTLGGSRLIDELASRGKLDVREVRGKWETFLITTVANPFPGLSRALVVVGSDRRGTAFGVYELSRQIGVSPWYWWADVPPKRSPSLFVRAGATRMGPPSVKYRGIFLNDEDWALQPWAARTFEPETGNIGPRTYAKIFELLLRLKANTVWPAMHASTRAFNLIPQNRLVADSFAIVMGSSHAEPMLRNNVGEWTGDAADYNYATNREGVRHYWEERVAENGRFENIYTLGMRGIHDSGLVGANTTAEKVTLLERIFTDQRSLLAKYVRPDPAKVPQLFVPYKEVLPVYRAGLKVPDDVTIVWPDDNHGFIRSFPTAEERGRSGGSGVYYHLSYLGAPLSYLWLYTTPPALVWEEMSKAYENGARNFWIANVGDLKPAEIGIDFWMQMAWDVGRWRRDDLPEYLVDWATRQFGPEHASEIAGILAEHFRLASQRRPEHLQWWLPGDGRRYGDLTHPLTEAEVWDRLGAYDALTRRMELVERETSAPLRDALFELVGYPVRGAALANARFFYAALYAANRAESNRDRDPAAAQVFAARSRAADARLMEETRRYNEEIAGGKWRHIVALEPADNQWQTLRIAPLPLPSAGLAAADTTLPPRYAALLQAHDGSSADAPLDDAPTIFVEADRVVSMEAEHFTGRESRAGVGWEVIPGLGRTGGGSVAIFPTTAASVDSARLRSDAPRLEYRMRLASAGSATVVVNLIPTFPLAGGRGLRLALGLDDQPPRLLTVGVEVDSREWAQGVLNGNVTGSVQLDVPAAGDHVLRVYMVDPGVVVDRIVLDLGGLRPSYLGPPETRTLSAPRALVVLRARFLALVPDADLHLELAHLRSVQVGPLVEQLQPLQSAHAARRAPHRRAHRLVEALRRHAHQLERPVLLRHALLRLGGRPAAAQPPCRSSITGCWMAASPRSAPPQQAAASSWSRPFVASALDQARTGREPMVVKRPPASEMIGTMGA
jgi:hypothetical protein